MKQKTLSIIIPTYNMEKYLRRCLDSLMVPNMDKLEILIINDGSKDSSPAIAHEYQDKYPGVCRVIDKENGNYGSCVNRGLKEAQGKYIKVLDADDTFETSNFPEFIDYLETTKADMVLSDFVSVDAENRVNTLCKGKDLPTDALFSPSKLSGALLMHSVTYKTDNVRSVPGGYHQTEGISYTDQEWVFLPIATMRTCAYFNKVIYRYLVGRDGQTVNQAIFLKNMWMEVKGFQNMVEAFNRLPENVLNMEYLRNKLVIRAGVIYRTCLTTMGKKDFDLRSLDRWLKEKAPWIYRECDHFTCEAPKFHLRSPYVRLWRKHRLNTNLKFQICKLYLSLRSLKKAPYGLVAYFDIES